MGAESRDCKTKTGSVYIQRVFINDDTGKAISETWEKNGAVLKNARRISNKLCRYLIDNPVKTIDSAMTMRKEENYQEEGGCLLYILNDKLYHSSSFVTDSDNKSDSKKLEGQISDEDILEMVSKKNNNLKEVSFSPGDEVNLSLDE